jgi:hypothetical protein
MADDIRVVGFATSFGAIMMIAGSGDKDFTEKK